MRKIRHLVEYRRSTDQAPMLLMLIAWEAGKHPHWAVTAHNEAAFDWIWEHDPGRQIAEAWPGELPQPDGNVYALVAWVLKSGRLESWKMCKASPKQVDAWMETSNETRGTTNESQ